MEEQTRADADPQPGVLITPLAAGADSAAAESVIELWQRCGLTRPWNDPADDLRRAVDGQGSAVLIATPNITPDTVLGTVMVGVDGHRGWVYYLAVAPAWRRTGLGRRLMRAAEDWLAARDAPKVQLMVREGNESVLQFYAALGYTDQGSVLLGRFLDPKIESLRRDHLGTSG